MELTESLTPIKRPHFHLREPHLYFLISKRPFVTFDDVDTAIWKSIDGVTSIAQLRPRFPQLDGTIRRFHDLGIIEVAEQFPEGRSPVLVVEPHMDDAILSVGGIMWQRRHECKFTVLSVVGRSNFTSYHRLDRDYYDVDTVSRLRCAESETIMRLLGGSHTVLNHDDAPLRFHPGKWTVDWHRKNRRAISAYINSSPTDAEIEAVIQSLLPVLRTSNASELWIPLGVGTSADHETTRNACIWILLRHPEIRQRLEIFFYQDVPYALNFPQHTGRLVQAFEAAGGKLEQTSYDVTQAMPQKLRMLSIFGSQFKPSYMDPKVVATANQVLQTKSACGELMFRVREFVTKADQLSFYSGKPYVESLVAKLEKWYPRHREAQRIRILCPMGVGRWQEHMNLLLEYFPKATFEIHITSDTIEETKAFTSPRIEIQPVNGLGIAWIFRSLRVLFSRPAPLVVLTHAKLHRIAPLISIGCFFASPLPATTFDHLAQALRLGQAGK